MRLDAQWRSPAVAVGLLRWLLTTTCMLLVASLLVFALAELVPGDPATTILMSQNGQPPTPEQIAAKRAELNLDDPFWLRYADWLGDLAHGDLGRSWTRPGDVSDLIGPRVGATLMLATLSLLLALALTLLAGFASVLRAGGLMDRTIRLFVVVFISVPSFVLGLLVLKFVVLRLGIGSVLSQPGLVGALLPASVLAAVIAAGWIRPFRALLRDASTSSAVFVAQARGIPRWRAMLRIAVPGALTEFLPFLALAIGSALGATMLIEVVFSFPGAAAFAVESARGRDLPVIQAFTLISVIAFRLGHDLISGVHWLMDPRLRTHAAAR